MEQLAGRLQKQLERLLLVEEELGTVDPSKERKRYRDLMQEHAHLSRVRTASELYADVKKDLEDNRQLAELESDPSFIALLAQEIASFEKKLVDIENELTVLLIPPDPCDNRNTILELRAGTGGDEAALFVADCARMYKLFADKMGWRYEVLSMAPSDLDGLKECILVFSGPEVYRHLRFEGGTHRVQRVPQTEAQGRIHTSTITVAVLLEPDEETDIKIDERDLRIDTYRSSGAGGQHVNTTDSAVRITHLPTKTVVYCQDERSQHSNRDKAMRLLKAKLAEFEREKQQMAISESRSQQVGTGDRSERIRTYNFPQNRFTDHRISFTSYNLDRIMEGDMLDIMRSLVTHFHQTTLP